MNLLFSLFLVFSLVVATTISTDYTSTPSSLPTPSDTEYEAPSVPTDFEPGLLISQPVASPVSIDSSVINNNNIGGAENQEKVLVEEKQTAITSTTYIFCTCKLPMFLSEFISL